MKQIPSETTRLMRIPFMNLRCKVLLFFLLLMPFLSKAVSISGPATVCQGDNAVYSVAASPDYIYVWAPGTKGKLDYSGIVGSLSEAHILWKKSGLSTITLLIIDKSTGSTVETATLNVTVLARPNPIISWDVEVGCQIAIPDVEIPDDPADMKIDSALCIKVCESSIVTYSVPATAGSSFVWNVSGGTPVSSGNTCTVTWGVAGAGSVEVVETSAGGCVGRKYMCIEIVKKPTANFVVMSDPSSDPVSACIFDKLVFNDLSTDNGGTALISWFWDFGDGTTSADRFPVHAYTSAGTYTVKLTVKNECNCTSEFERTIVVGPESGARIVCPGLVCENTTAKYSVAESCTSYSWSVIGGTILSTMPYSNKIEVNWNAVGPDGIGYVSFDATACSVDCPSKTVIKVPVMKTIGIIKGKNIICTNQQYRYTLPRYPATVYNWSIAAGGTGAKIIHTDQTNEVIVEGSSPGYITLSCTYNNTLLTGCSGNATLSIELQNPPAISGSKLTCEGSVQSYSLSTMASADWTLEGPGGVTTYSGTTFTQTFSTPGNYRLSATGSFCWPEPIEIVVDALPPVPVAITGPAELCPGSPGNYLTSVGEAKSIFVWRIVSGIGTLNMSSGAMTTFTPGSGSSGPWVIAVKSRNKKAPMCESDEISFTINEPSVGSTAVSGSTTPCHESYFSYHEAYTLGYDYKWSLSDPGAGSITGGGSGPNPTILWNTVSSPRTCTIHVEFKQCGVTYTDNLSVTIQPGVTPVVNEGGPYCPGQLVDFTTVPGTDLKGGTLSVSDWGDGATTGTTHVYSDGGKYIVKLSVYGAGGCDATFDMEKEVEVYTKPSISITGGGSFCSPSPAITLTATSSTGASSWAWSSGSVTATQFFGPGALGIGLYSYTVNVVDPNGCTASEEVKVNIIDCSGGSSGTPACVPAGSTTLGAYTLVANCIGSATTTLSRTGTAFLYAAESALPKDVGHTADMASVSGGTATFVADRTIVGDHKYWFYSYYNTSTMTPCPKVDLVTVQVPLYVNFNWAISCGTGGKYDVSCKSLTSFYEALVGTTGHSYLWTVTKLPSGTSVTYGPSTALSTLSGLALDPGSDYDVTLQVSTGSIPSYTCVATKRISLPALPVASYTVDYTPICEGVPVSFNSTSTGTGLKERWYFGDLESNTKNQRTYTHTGGPTPDVWDSYLEVTDKYGCVAASGIIPITVHKNNLGGAVTASSHDICPDDVLTLSFAKSFGTDDPTSLIWMRDATPLGVSSYPSGFTVAEPESGYYGVEIRGNYGCVRNSSSDYVRVVNVPDPFIVGKPDVCVGEAFVLNAYAGDDVVSYSWEVYDGSWNPVAATAPYYDLSQTLTTPGTYKYRVTISVPKTGPPTPTFCTATSEEFELTVHGLPTVPVISYSMMDCSTYELQLSATSPDAGTYTWSNGLSGSPITVYAGGPYKVTLTDAYGCSSSNQDYIFKDPKEYLWVFPTGCYSLCPAPYFVLNGPAIRFSYWEWDRNYTNVLSGTGMVTPYHLATSGVYNLHLDNGLCAATSDDLDFDAVGCFDSSCGQNVNVVLDSVSYSGGCRARLYLHVYQYHPGGPKPYSLLPEMGGYINIIAGPGALVPGGTGNVIIAEWVAPSPGGFPSGALAKFKIVITLPGGLTCTKEFTVEMNCPYGDVLHRNTQQGASSITEEEGALLLLAPNPAKGATSVVYATGSVSADGSKSIAVFDMTGRRLYTVPLEENSGKLELRFDNWAAGAYQVVLLQGNTVIRTSLLSIAP